MQSDSGRTTSVWRDTAEAPLRSSLTQNAQANVCIVGAGITGLTIAYLLARGGASVTVVDDGPIGGGETGRTTAHLTNMLDESYSDASDKHGDRGAQLAAQSHTRAIDVIEQIARDESIECDFARVDGYLMLAPGDNLQTLSEELQAARDAGLVDTEMVDRAPLTGYESGPCLKFPRQAQFHVLKYLVGLAEAVERYGGTIYTGTHILKVQGGRQPRLETSTGYTITARSVVLATNAPINDVLGYSAKQAPYRTYVIGLEVPHESVTPGLYYDTEDPYHYVRLYSPTPIEGKTSSSNNVLIIGGEDHKTGQDDDGADARYQRLEAWARERFPMAQEMVYWWSGQVMQSADGLAYIGRDLVDENVYVATGDTGVGMTHGTIAGILLSDLILGRVNLWAELYDPARIKTEAGGELIREGLNVAGQYAKWLGFGDGSEVTSLEQIAPDSGAVVQRGLSRIAVYRDQDGLLHERSAACTHLGCIVAWNDGEKSWDCPCHGSRFSALGEVVHGPAAKNLAPPDDRPREG